MERPPLSYYVDIGEIHALWDTIANLDQQIAIRDLFAVGCDLHSRGFESVGVKVCNTALSALAAPAALRRRILGRLAGNEAVLALAFWPHVEVEGLFKWAGPSRLDLQFVPWGSRGVCRP